MDEFDPLKPTEASNMNKPMATKNHIIVSEMRSTLICTYLMMLVVIPLIYVQLPEALPDHELMLFICLCIWQSSVALAAWATMMLGKQ